MDQRQPLPQRREEDHVMEIQWDHAERYREALIHIASICGNPDKDLALRLILMEVKDAIGK